MLYAVCTFIGQGPIYAPLRMNLRYIRLRARNESKLQKERGGGPPGGRGGGGGSSTLQTCAASHKVKSSQSHDFDFFQNSKKKSKSRP
jgi:hypothetical protein